MQRLDMTKGFPETVPFCKLTGPCFPSQSLERTSWVVNTDERGRRGDSGEIRVAQGGRSLPTDAGWATPRRLPELKREARAQYGASLVPERPGAMSAFWGLETEQALQAGPHQYPQTRLSRKWSLAFCCLRVL